MVDKALKKREDSIDTKQIGFEWNIFSTNLACLNAYLEKVSESQSKTDLKTEVFSLSFYSRDTKS